MFLNYHTYLLRYFSTSKNIRRLFFGSFFIIFTLLLSRPAIAEYSENSKKDFMGIKNFFGIKTHKSRMERVFDSLGINDLTFKTLNNKTGNIEEVKYSARERQIAIIEILHYFNAFSYMNIKHGIYNIGGTFGPLNKKPEEAMRAMDVIMHKSNAYNINGKDFMPEVILNELFHSKVFDDEDAEDITLYLLQTIYPNRKKIENKNFRKVNQSDFNKYEKILINFKTVGMIDSFYSMQKSDELWVMCSGRRSFERRVFFLKDIFKTSENIHSHFNSVIISTGYRRLWAEIDGIGKNNEDVLSEGINYMAKLARKNKIKPKQDSLFIEGSECDKNTCSKKTYFNDDGKYLSEPLMCFDVYEAITGDKDYIFTESKPAKGKSRADTESCTLDSLSRTFKNFNKDEIKITLLSNQPYILRQSKSASFLVKKVSRELMKKEIKPIIFPIGSPIFDKDQYMDIDGLLTTLRTEIASLVSEGYKENECFNYTSKKRDYNQIKEVSIARRL